MPLLVYTLEQNREWDMVVCSFKEFDVYYLSGYAKAFQLHGDGEPLLFYYEDNSLRGINVVMKRDIAKDPYFSGLLSENTYFDFATPYGYGGWLFEGTGEQSRLFEHYIKWCNQHSIVSEFVRFNLFCEARKSYYGDVIPRTNNIVRELDRPMEDMMMDFEHKVRKNIRRAKESGLMIQVDMRGERLDEFLSIYYSTMERKNASETYYFSKEFYLQMNTMKNHIAYFHALLNGKVISTELVIMGSDTMYSFLGGTDRNYYLYRPNDYLKYSIINWGLENAYKRFVLGGGYGADDGIFHYKKSFAPGGVVQFYTGQAIFNNEYYGMLKAMRGTNCVPGFFPEYRANVRSE